MKIAIHKSTWGFSQDWISWCDKNEMPYKIVNCHASDIVEQLKDCDALMWHHHHSIAKDAITARQLLLALQHSGFKVFPDFNTGWHFDDKVGQKYLLEAIGAPVVPTWVFYEGSEALTWISKASFPKVFKLRGGAGSSNVRLVKNRRHAGRLVNQAFGRGFASYNKTADLKEQLRKFKGNKDSWMASAKCLRRLFVSTRFARTVGPQRGYVLFQEYIEDNDHDIRVVVIGKRAFAIKRMVRDNDFRASGSGVIEYDKNVIDPRCIEIAFDITSKLKAQCVAYDFVFDAQRGPLITEVNYGFAHQAYYDCSGYWDNKLNWHDGHFNAAEWIIEEVVRQEKNALSQRSLLSSTNGRAS